MIVLQLRHLLLCPDKLKNHLSKGNNRLVRSKLKMHKHSFIDITKFYFFKLFPHVFTLCRPFTLCSTYEHSWIKVLSMINIHFYYIMSRKTSEHATISRKWIYTFILVIYLMKKVGISKLYLLGSRKLLYVRRW